MTRSIYILVLVFAQLAGSASAAPDRKVVAPNSGDTYVLVHGAWGGGWAWKEVQRLLEAQGHTVYRPTLTGHGERAHLSSPEVDLSLHIQDVVNLIRWEQLEDVILVGHSYGGMVVTGVADRAPEAIAKLVYIDAIVPRDGESVNTAFGRDGQHQQESSDGFAHPAWVEDDQPIPHDVPHSLKCFSEPIALKNALREGIPSLYLYLVDPGMGLEEDAFHRFYLRALEDGWDAIVKEDWDHNPQWSRPKELVDLL